MTLTYTVEIDDGDGGTATQTFDVVITGSNDAPIVAAIADTPLTEQSDTEPLTADIAVTFGDVDLNDVGHEATVTDVSVDGEDGGLMLTQQQLIDLAEHDRVRGDADAQRERDDDEQRRAAG